MSRTQNSLETPAPPALQSADTVKLNWIFFDRTSPIAHSAAIFIPRNIFEEALQNCVELFIRRLYEEYYLIAHAQDIIFWKPRNALLIEDAEKPGWVASVDDDERDLFDRCPTYLSLSNILAPRAVNDEKMVHLVLESSSKFLRDNEDLVDRWMSKRLAIPSLADLPSVLGAPLTDKISINQSTYTRLSSTTGEDRCSENTIQSVFKIGEPYENFFPFISTIFNNPARHYEKANWYFFWNRNIYELFLVLLPRGTSNRYSDEPSQMRNVPPNYAFVLSNMCLFRGEEAAPWDTEDLMLRMSAKVNWIYEFAPYMLGYCCKGPNMTFVALTPPPGSQGGRPTVHKLATFDLRWRRGRIDNMRHLINLATILPLLKKLVRSPVNDWRNFDPKWENDTPNLFTRTLTEVQVERLRHVHAILKKYQVPNTDALTFSESNSKVQPHRSLVRPQTEKQLRECLQCILETLRVAHSIPLYHCNVRWENVLCEDPDSHKWILMNWENAASESMLAKTATSGSLPSPSHSPFDGREAEMDIWSIWYLIQTCGIQDISEEVIEIGERVRQQSQTSSADDVYILIAALPVVN